MPYPRKGRWGYAVPSDDQFRLRLTHFLCIPMATSKSRSQLYTARQRLMRDPVTRNIPTEAFVWPDTQKLTLGALSLTSDDKIQAARSLLQCLDLNTMLEDLRIKEINQYNPGMSHNPGGPYTVKPVSVSINGLEPSAYLQNCLTLLGRSDVVLWRLIL